MGKVEKACGLRKKINLRVGVGEGEKKKKKKIKKMNAL